jgi:peptidoglycan/LPS O-acetylase OafA/YrhL
LVSFVLIRKHRGAENPFRIIPALFVVIATGCFVLRWLTVASLPPEDAWHAQFLTHLRIDSLFFGVLISYLMHFKASESVSHRLKAKRPLLLILGMALCSLPFFFDYHTTPWMSVEGPAILFLGAGALLLAVTGANLAQNRLAVWSAGLGAYSYSVYLWHRPIQSWTQPIFDRYIGGIPGWVAGTTFYLISSWIIGIGLSKLIEMPVLRIRDRLFPGITNSLSAVASAQKAHATR